MDIEVLPGADAVARRGALMVQQQARQAIAERGRFVFAVSGGSTPWRMLSLLASESLPWDRVHIVQVDERIAPAGHPDRNLTQLVEALKEQKQLPSENVHAMPVNAADLEAASSEYVRTLEGLVGTPVKIDLIHLGLGNDGHTASLVPNDPVLEVTQADVALSGEYQGRRRMTLTYPAINRARHILWLVTGAGKEDAVAQMVASDRSVPAGRVRQASANLLVDVAAGSHLQRTSHQQRGED